MKQNIKLEYILVLILIILGIYNLFYPFLNSNVTDEVVKKKVEFECAEIKDKVQDKIRGIEEDSQIDVYKVLGGIDEVNGDNNLTGIKDRRTLVIQESDLGKELDEDKEPFMDSVVMFIYKSDCPNGKPYLHSSQHIELITMLNNSNYSFKYIDLNTLDKYGFTYLHISAKLRLNNEKGDVGLPFVLFNDTYINTEELKLKDANEIFKKISIEGFVEGFDNSPETTKAKCPNDFKSVTFDHIQDMLQKNKDLSENLQGKKKVTIGGKDYYEYDDVDEDGCVKANFEICDANSENPGYRLFTHRGHHGCLKPDVDANLDAYSAAFSVFDSYLSSLPSEQDAETGGDKVYNADDCDENSKLREEARFAKMKTCANKYRDNISNFGLCDNKEKLEEHMNAPKNIKLGRKKPNFEMTAEDYEASAKVAGAIYNACGYS